MKEYKYGMRHPRGFSPGCQPKGVIRREDDPAGKYYDIIVYDRKLTDKELYEYELDDLNLKLFRVTYEVVFEISADDETEAEEIANELMSNGEFESYPVIVEEIEERK